jgi:transposase
VPTDRSCHLNIEKGDMAMVICGIDAHKRTHTVVVIDGVGRQLGTKTTTSTTSEAHLELVEWAARFGSVRRWAIEDCRTLSRRLEGDLLRAGEAVVRVPPKLMAQTRAGARSYGKSDPIDALAVARAALREPDLPTARLDGPARELRLWVDHREDLVAERTRWINRLRWHLHELDPSWDPPAKALSRPRGIEAVIARLGALEGVVARLAQDLAQRICALTHQERALQTEIARLVAPLAPTLLALAGVGPLTAAKIVGEIAGAERFRSKDAFARHNGTAPVPVWSANHPRHRLARTGNRQLNCALHRIAIAQARSHPDAQTYLARRATRGDTRRDALRALKRRLSDVVYRALLADTTSPPAAP